jgi:hypothetical protein
LRASNLRNLILCDVSDGTNWRTAVITACNAMGDRRACLFGAAVLNYVIAETGDVALACMSKLTHDVADGKASVASMIQVMRNPDRPVPIPQEAGFCVLENIIDKASSRLLRADDPVSARLKFVHRVMTILREVAGPLWRQTDMRPEWVTEDVRAMAEAAYGGDWGVMPVLGDALEEAGCDDRYILAHARGDPGCMHLEPHRCLHNIGKYRHCEGCWVIESIRSVNAVRIPMAKGR